MYFFGVSVVASVLLVTFVMPIVTPAFTYNNKFMIGERSVGEFARSPCITAYADAMAVGADTPSMMR